MKKTPEQDNMKQEPTGSWTTLGAALLPWVVGGTVLACFLVLAFGSYFILSTADPHTWLNFARDFLQKLERSKFPFGYPLYLKGILAMVGPYWVFLANLPMMLGMFATAGWFGTLIAAEERQERGDAWEGVPRSWGFLTVWVLILGANSDMLLVYLNPYRDPLSYLLILTSAGVFVQSLKARRMWGVGAAGLLLGLACSVREPSVLVVLPLFAYGLLAWRSGRPEIQLWRAVGAFALGMGLGVAPLLAQTYYATHQVLVPHYLLMNIPETQEESKIVPGMYFSGARLAGVVSWALSYYWRTEKLILFLAAVGLIAAIVRRNRLVWTVVVPTAVGYAVFYSFYRRFFPRYFYVAVVFLALLAGHGLLALLRLLCTKIRSPRAGRAMGWLLLAVLACATSSRLLGERAKAQPHQVPQARAMTAVIRDICPAPSAVYADRPLCEWIGWFLHCKSDPLAIIRPNPELPGCAGSLRDALSLRLKRGENVYAAFWRKDVQTEFDVPFARRALDCFPVGSFDPRDYAADGYADGIVWFYRLCPWTNLTTAVNWSVPGRGPHGGAYWFMVDAGDWPDGHAPAHITVEGNVDGIVPIPHGGTWVGSAEAEEADAGGTVAASIASADPLPRVMPVRTGRMDEPLVLDFCPGGEYDHYWRWSGDVLLPAIVRGRAGVCIRTSGDLEVPVPRPDLAGAIVKLELRAVGVEAEESLSMEITENGRPLARVEVSGDTTPQQVIVPLPLEPDRASRQLHFDVAGPSPQASGTHPEAAGIECTRAIVYRWPVSLPVEIGMGQPNDKYILLSGFSRPMGRGDGAFRWTTGAAELVACLPASEAPLVLRVEGSVQGMPWAVLEHFDADFCVSWDGAELPGQLEMDPRDGTFVWTGRLPAGAGDGRTPHRMGLETPMWQPADSDNRLPRDLGARITQVDIVPMEVWTRCSTSLEWPVPGRGPHGGAYWYMVDVGDWPAGHAPARIMVEGANGALSSIFHGGTWVGRAEAEVGDGDRSVAATIASADPLPPTMPIRTGRIDEPLVLDFCPGGEFNHCWRWSGDIALPIVSRMTVGAAIRLRTAADLELPVPRPDLAGAAVKVEFRASGMNPDVDIPVEISEEGRLLARVDVPGDQTPKQTLIPLPCDSGRESRVLHFNVGARSPQASDVDRIPAEVECPRAILLRWPVSFPVEIGLGRAEDEHILLSGFSRTEGRGDASFRWTTGSAEIAVLLPATEAVLALRVEGSVSGIPGAVAGHIETNLRIFWDGDELSGELERDGNGGFVWVGELPSGAGDGRTPHRLGVETPTWRPADFGIRDSRTLGVRMGRIQVAPRE